MSAQPLATTPVEDTKTSEPTSADMLEAIRKLRHFAHCMAMGVGDPRRGAREVLEMTKEFATPSESFTE